LRDPGGSGHSVAQLLCGLDDRLSLCRESYVLARISSKCRCAKRECEDDAYVSDRPAAQATWSAYCFHALIVMRLRISCKLIRTVTGRAFYDIAHAPAVGANSPSAAAGRIWCGAVASQILLARGFASQDKNARCGKWKKYRRPGKGELLSLDELARALGETPRTIRNWKAKGLIPTLVLDHRSLRFRLDSVLAALGRREVK
jgi:hypothetical protein